MSSLELTNKKTLKAPAPPHHPESRTGSDRKWTDGWIFDILLSVPSSSNYVVCEFLMCCVVGWFSRPECGNTLREGASVPTAAAGR